MPSMISYSIGYSAIDASGTSVVVTPPPAYASGNLLIMGVIAGGTATAISASAPSGWTALSGSGTPGVFYKTATGSEPSNYTVSLSGTACAAVFVAAYPAATITNSVFQASSVDATSYSPTFPSGVTSSETVLLIAGAVAAASDANGNAGYQNVNLPLGSEWTTRVPAFGPALPAPSPYVYPCAIGFADVSGSTSTPLLTSPQGCNIYTTYVVLTVSGTTSSLPVTATVYYPEGNPGLALTVKAISGAAPATSIIAGGATTNFYAAGTSQAPAASITPNAGSSLIYGAVTENFGVTGGLSYTANAVTTFSQNVPDSTWSAIYGTFRSSGLTSAGSAITLGGTTPTNAYTTAALAEILAASGSSLSETATAIAKGIVPGNFATASVSQTAIFSSAPASNALLVAMISANSLFENGNAFVTVKDSSGLTWVPLVESIYPSYSAVWIGYSPTSFVTVSLPVAQVTSTAYPLVTPGSNKIQDEASGDVLDEAGNFILDESGGGNVTVGLPAAQAAETAYPLTVSGSVIVNLPVAQVAVTSYPLMAPVNVTINLPVAQSPVTAYPLASLSDVAGLWQQQSPITIGGNGSYTVSAWVWTEQFDVNIGIYWLAAGNVADGSIIQTVTIQPATWTFITMTATAPSSAMGAYPFLSVIGSGASFYAAHVTLVDANAEVPYLPSLGLGYDNTYLQNITQATLTQGANTLISPVEKDPASIASYLTRGPQTVTVNGSSAQDAYDIAYWYLAKYKQPQLRVDSVTVDAATNPQVFTSVLQYDLADISTLNRRPVGAPPYSLPVICEKVTHSIGPGTWKVSYQLSPYVQENEVLIPDGGADQDTLGSTTLAW